MDAGRPEAFLHLFSVIEENDLIRYSSVRRAVSTWIGIFNEKSVDRISEKLLRLMGSCLRDEEFRKEQLASEDSVAISCALWALGFYRNRSGIFGGSGACGMLYERFYGSVRNASDVSVKR